MAFAPRSQTCPRGGKRTGSTQVNTRFTLMPDPPASRSSFAFRISPVAIYSPPREIHPRHFLSRAPLLFSWPDPRPVDLPTRHARRCHARPEPSRRTRRREADRRERRADVGFGEWKAPAVRARGPRVEGGRAAGGGAFKTSCPSCTWERTAGRSCTSRGRGVCRVGRVCPPAAHSLPAKWNFAPKARVQVQLRHEGEKAKRSPSPSNRRRGWRFLTSRRVRKPVFWSEWRF